MAEIDVLDKEGKKVSNVKVAEGFLKPVAKSQVVVDTLVAIRANARRGTANTKTKSEVNFSGAKPWRQKGTGRARSGERSSPIWRKGSVVFGPRPRSYRKTVNRQVRQAALHRVLAELLTGNRIVLVDHLAVEQPKTKLLAGLLEKWKVSDKTLLVLDKADKNVFLAARNIPGISTVVADSASVYDLLNCRNLLTTPAGLQILKARAGHGHGGDSK